MCLVTPLVRVLGQSYDGAVVLGSRSKVASVEVSAREWRRWRWSRSVSGRYRQCCGVVGALCLWKPDVSAVRVRFGGGSGWCVVRLHSISCRLVGGRLQSIELHTACAVAVAQDWLRSQGWKCFKVCLNGMMQSLEARPQSLEVRWRSHGGVMEGGVIEQREE